MSESCPESNQSSRTGPGTRRDWVYDNPPEVDYKIVVPGMAAPIGWFKQPKWIRVDLKTQLGDGEVVWDAVDLGTVRLSHPIHLMLIEGISPTTLFLGAKLVELASDSILSGPYVLLHVTADPLHKVPFCFHDVALGRLTSAPEGAKLTELVPLMVSELLSKLET